MTSSTLVGDGLGSLLGVWAHPDDEAYLSAGLMAVARRHGQRVVVATATMGERGSTSPTATAADMGIFPEGSTPPETPAADAAAVIHCDGWVLDRKARAMRAHGSQVHSLVERVGEPTFRSWWSVEAFVDASQVLAGELR